jgi:hypothetical protein
VHFKKIGILFLIMVLIFSGCSTNLYTVEAYNFLKEKKEATREEIEDKFGKPIRSTPLENGGSLDVYEFVKAPYDRPSKGPSVREIAEITPVGILLLYEMIFKWDIVGIKELFSMPFDQPSEISNKKIEITYDKNSVMRDFRYVQIY